MATSAFRSSTRRSTAPDDAASSNLGGGTLRRSRSLSRPSGRHPPPPQGDSDNLPLEADLGFPEVSLDDLADEFFRRNSDAKLESDEEVRRPAVGRSGRRGSDFGYRMETESSRRRGRSVSRSREPGGRKGVVESDGNGGSKDAANGRPRRQRSVSVARNRFSDSESHSSTLTDDEIRRTNSTRSMAEKTIQAVYSQKKTELANSHGDSRLYEAMRKEVRHAVEDIRTQLERGMVKTDPIAITSGDDGLSNSSNVIQAIAEVRRNYTTKLEQSEKRRQDLLAELAAEEQHGQELTMIVRELLPPPKQTSTAERSPRCRRRSSDKTKMSRCLSEEAEKFIEDFLSSVEDADISSYDGERSDTSSTFGGSMKFRSCTVHNTGQGTEGNLAKPASTPGETDGVLLPWLEWETANNGSSPPCKSRKALPMDSGNSLSDELQEATGSFTSSNYFLASQGSWSPEGSDSCSAASKGMNRNRFGVGILPIEGSTDRSKRPAFDMDEYAYFQCNEDLLFERFQQRLRIESGSLVLCGRTI